MRKKAMGSCLLVLGLLVAPALCGDAGTAVESTVGGGTAADRVARWLPRCQA